VSKIQKGTVVKLKKDLHCVMWPIFGGDLLRIDRILGEKDGQLEVMATIWDDTLADIGAGKGAPLPVSLLLGYEDIIIDVAETMKTKVKEKRNELRKLRQKSRRK